MTIWNHTIIFIMTLLAKNSMGLILVLALFFYACEDPNGIGLELKGDPDRIGAFYKEIELETSLINNDSLFTLSVVRLLSGKTYNPDYGEMMAAGYTQFGFSSAELNIPDSATYDSLVLEIVNDYSFGTGILTNQRFTIHELTEDLYDTAAYFSFSSAAFDPLPLAAGDFLLPERSDTILSFRMEDAFGQRLFEAAKDTNVVDPSEVKTLLQLFKGLAIISDEANNSIMGINVLNDSTALRLYYTYDDSTYNYPFGFKAVANFNQFLTNRTGTPLQGIEDIHYQDFIPENDKAYIQSGANLVSKIDFGPLMSFFDTIDYVNINLGSIDITIDEPLQNERPPSSLSFYYTNEDNKRIQASGGYIGIRDETSGDLLRAGFVEDELNYQGTITLFLDNLIKGYISETAVLMYPPDFGLINSVNQLIISPGNVKLKIYYSRVK